MKATFSDRYGHPIVCYADGSCLNNGYNGAQAGVGIVLGDGMNLENWGRVRGLQTNNCAERWAVVCELQNTPNPRLLLEIRTDSEYAIGWVRDSMAP
jgi:ribonuclease HI